MWSGTGATKPQTSTQGCRVFGFVRRPRVVAALSVVVVLALAGGAFAYFTSTGSGTGSATVGSASNFTVTPSAATGGPLYPAAGTTNIAYTVTNASSGAQELNGTSAAVASDASGGANSGDVLQGGTTVPGCLAAWFTATNHSPTTPAPPTDLAADASATGGSVDVTMQDSGSNQDACQGVKPDITISAN